ncbi:MAG: hypothetical protein GDA51_03590 [Ekhidna sp.]|nr:hypothetical protein [Ekhidna sp.]
MDRAYLPRRGVVLLKVDTWKRAADGDGVCTCLSVSMGSVSFVGVVIGRFVFPPVYGVAVAASRGRDGNGFISSFRFPCGDKGFCISLCLPEECEENCRNNKKGTFCR